MAEDGDFHCEADGLCVEDTTVLRAKKVGWVEIVACSSNFGVNVNSGRETAAGR